MAVALDEAGGKLYWTSCGGFYTRLPRIQRSNWDGSNVEELVTAGLNCPAGIALDLMANKMYWSDATYMPGLPGKIRRANLDGSQVEDLVDLYVDDFNPVAIALELSEENKLYWVQPTGSLTNGIFKANLDGSDVEQILPSLDQFVRGIAVDWVHGKIYWAGHGATGPSRIYRASINGSDVEQIFNADDCSAYGVAVDGGAGKLCWASHESLFCGQGRIQCANLDGSNVQTITANTNHPTFITIDTRTAGDVDHDGSISLRDFIRFQFCYTGSGGEIGLSGCTFFDVDGDSDIGADDYTAFYSVFVGP